MYYAHVHIVFLVEMLLVTFYNKSTFILINSEMIACYKRKVVSRPLPNVINYVKN